MLLVLKPSGMSLTLNRPNLLVGRHSDADIRLPLPDVSRRHCRFMFTEGGWRVIDLQSLNGIFVNGERLEQADLNHQDRVRIGGFIFEVDFKTEPVAGAGLDLSAARSAILNSIVNTLTPPNGQRRAS